MRLPSPPALPCLAMAIGLALAGASAGAEGLGEEFFERQVRPILVARCYECHSAKAEKVQGNLRLDSRAGVLKGGDTGAAVVPGKLKESLLVDAINYGELYQMPPKSKLPVEEIAILTKWVEMGAPWGQESGDRGQGTESGFDLAKRKAEHWCWQPIRRAPAPEVRNLQSEIQNPIDAFILAKLEAAGLSPAPPADKRTLIRRAYFDLIGLPPTPEEIAAIMSFEDVVDRLLASPRFGERWGRHWLDLVRYAESRGHEFDYDIPNAYEYRDYVIRALNADVPYDQFVIEHVAGDLLEQPRLHPADGFNESIIGTGYWFLGEWCHSPVDIRKDECDRIDNMLDVFSKTFLGVTVACARCHDHKFDAISQQDYYALAGYVQSSAYRLARFETWEQDRKTAADLAALDGKYRPRIAAAVCKQLARNVDDLATKLAADAERLKVELGVPDSDLKGAKVIVDDWNLAPEAWMTNGPMFGSGPIRAGTLTFTGDPAQPLKAAVYATARIDPAWADVGMSPQSANDPGRLGGWLRAGRTLKTPTFVLKSGYVHYLIEGVGYVYAAVDSHAMINGPLHGELQKDTGGNSDLPTRWITHDLTRYVGHRVHLEFSPKEDEDFRVLMVVDGHERPAAPANRPNRILEGMLGVLGASSRDAILAACRKVVVETLDELEHERVTDAAQPGDRAALVNWLIGQGHFDGRQNEVARLLASYEAERKKLCNSIQNESRLCLAMWEGTPVDENLLIRGNHKTVGPVAQKRTLEALKGSEFRVQGSEGGGRLELARGLVDPGNPLVSRVIVNRVWQHLMGRGIVPSVDNLGVLGQTPTHPELLDYLAAEFMREGWSVKRLVRRIMLSRTYQQGSGIGSQGSGDSENLLFLRQHIKRLEGEAIRDAMLAISGRLDASMYGSSAPVYLTPFMQGRGRPKDSGPLDGAGRRSVYTAVRRNFISPMMLAFDTPIPFTTIGRRNSSNVPAQALILMNDPFVAEQARVWAKNVMKDTAISTGERICRMYLAAFSREPTASEVSAAQTFLGQQADEYGISGKQAEGDERVWADFGHVLINTKEFVFVD